MNLRSNLTFNFNKPLDICIEKPNQPLVIYRDFDNEQHRANFLKGNIWFSGPNQNRFFLRDKDRKDPQEYRNNFSSYIYEYSLSFTTEKPTTRKPIVQINNINGFINGIAHDLINEKYTHTVSWLSMDELHKHIPIVPAISQIHTYPSDDNVCLWIQGISGRRVIYVNKIDKLPTPYNGMELAWNARNKSDKHAVDKEWRISLLSGDFSTPNNGLQNLVEYLKLHCPSVSNHCAMI